MRIPKAALLLGAGLMAGGMVVSLGGLGHSVNAATGPGPTLTVVGYGVVNMTAQASNGPQQLQIYMQASGSTAPATVVAFNRDVVKVKTQLEKAGVSANAISTQGPPNLNINNNGGGFNVNQTLQVTLPTMLRLADVLQTSGVANDGAVQNVFVNPLYSGAPVATAAQLTAGYKAAFANAQQTAQDMAQGDNLQLGQSVSITEGGQSSGGCNAMGACNPISVGNPPQVGANQELVTVTVTYDTSA